MSPKAKYGIIYYGKISFYIIYYVFYRKEGTMKNRHFPFKKLIALILALVTICSLLASCKSIDEGNGSESASDISIGSITIFANGAYTAKLIHDGTPTGKTIAEKLGKIISDYTGVLLIAEDSYAAYAGDAILIGNTLDPEATIANSALGNDAASATLVSNKYVLAFTSQESAESLLNTFKTTLSTKATNLQITIDSAWNLNSGTSSLSTNKNTSSSNGNGSSNTTSSSGNETFDESTLKASATLPKLGTSYDAGQSSKTYVTSNATASSYTTICKGLETNGFKKYTTNKIGNNEFATYLTKSQIVHVMYLPNRKEVRTAVDKRGTGESGFALTGLSGDNKYTKTTNSEMIVCDISNSDWPGGMCIIFKLSDGRFFIIDAGMGGKLADNRKWIGSSSGWIYATLSKFAKDPKNIQVAGWLITHVHSDHAGGLYDMALGYHGATNAGKHTVMPKEVTKYIKIDKLIYNQPATTKFGRNGWMSTIIKAFNVKNVVKAHPGQVFYAADLKLTVYGAQDLMLEKSGSSGDLNDFSVVSRAEFNGKSVLLLGDSDTIPNPRLAALYKETLKSDMLQLAHHGYGDTGDADVNSYCNPSMVLWVVSNSDQRSGKKINVNRSIASLKNVKHYKPGTGNLIFKSDWSTYTQSANTIISAIPKCDGTHCGNKSCSKKTSTWNSYNS